MHARARVPDPKGLVVLEINGRTGYNVRLRADDYFARIKLEYFSTSPLNVFREWKGLDGCSFFLFLFFFFFFFPSIFRVISTILYSQFCE